MPVMQKRSLSKVPRRGYLILLLVALSTFFTIHYVLKRTWTTEAFDPVALIRDATLGHRLLTAYDPVPNAAAITAVLKHQCRALLPKLADLEPEKKAVPAIAMRSLSRFVMYFNVCKHLQDLVSARNPGDPKLRVLDLGGSVFLKCHGIGDAMDVLFTKFPEVDAHHMSFADDSFDMVASDQMLEHAIFPHAVILEVHRVLKPGGIAVVTTVAYNPVHETAGWHDFWRFQPDGMRMLALPFKGGIKLCGSWGTNATNSARSRLGILSKRETEWFRENFAAEAMRNEHYNPMSTWLIAEK